MNGLVPDSSGPSNLLILIVNLLKGRINGRQNWISELINIGVLFEGDLCEFANLMLKIYDATNKGTNTVTRDTVNGLVHGYALLARVNSNQVLSVIKRYGLSLGSTIEHDKDVTQNLTKL